MKRLLAVLTLAAAVAIVAAVALASSGRPASSGARMLVSPTNLPTATPTGQQSLYGHIKTLEHVGGRLELRFDPAWYTMGLTARVLNRGTVPNDRYVFDEGHRLLTYVVAPTAKVRVLINNGSGPKLKTIKLSELVRIVNGGPHRTLFEPLSTGVWIRVHSDTILEINQQYQA